MFCVLQTSWLTGKTSWAIISSSLNLEFALLNLVSMSVLMLDRFLAVYLDLKYFTWKTPKKAKIAVFVMWLVCTILTALSSVHLFGMDFEGEPLIVSRRKIFQERKVVVASLMALSKIASTVIGMLTNYFIHQKKKQLRKLHPQIFRKRSHRIYLNFANIEAAMCGTSSFERFSKESPGSEEYERK
ncbi:hypothetical protein ACROYT_G011100 [Oculina patagonica]